MNDRVVVGYNETPSAESALEWALDYADHRHAELDLVHVIDDKWGPLSRKLTGQALLEAEHRLRNVAERITEAHPGLHVHPTVVEGSPMDTITEKADGADLLVIGSHKVPRFDDMVFSTRAAHIASLATCAVAVIPEGRPLAGAGVVVGVDGSTLSIAALSAGAREADRLGQSLSAVYAWRALAPWDLIDADSHPVATDSDRLVLSEAIAGLAEDYPDLPVLEVLSDIAPVDALVAAATGARLLLVGTHGRHGLTRMWLGSVSNELVLSLPCPVMIVKHSVAG
jgi:nucleotide-binding universal stress UspA family protein